MSSWKILGIKIRAVNSVLLVFLSIPVAISSIYLYLAPYGSGGRQTWNYLHVFLGFVLIASATLHITMNWRALRVYLRKKIHQTIEPRTEGVIAFMIFAVLLIGVLVYPLVITNFVNHGWISADSQLASVAPADGSCNSCPYLYSYGGCHSGDSFNYNGRTYYGYNTTQTTEQTNTYSNN